MTHEPSKYMFNHRRFRIGVGRMYKETDFYILRRDPDYSLISFYSTARLNKRW